MSQDILGSLVRVLVTVPGNRLGVIKDFTNKLAGSDGEEWEKQGKLFLCKKSCWANGEINTLIRVDRLAYPDWVKKIMHPALEGVGPAEYDLTKVVLRLHDDQKDGGYTTGHKIYEHLKATDSLKNCLGLDDALAIQKNGVAAFRKAFGNKVVVCWRSVVRFQDGGLYVPFVYDSSDEVVVGWRWLDDFFDGYRPAGCFAQ